MLSVTTAMTGLAADDRVVLSVRRLLPNGRWARMYGAAWTPNAAGELTQMLTLPVATRGRPICVIARAVPAGVKLDLDQRPRPVPAALAGMTSVQALRAAPDVIDLAGGHAGVPAGSSLSRA